MTRVLVVFGTRPEALKLVPIIHELKRRSSQFETVVCVTGQHRDMLDQVLVRFSIKPDYDLDLMQKNQDLFSLTGRIVTSMKDVLEQSRPRLVIVQGDTTTAFCASLSAYYQKTDVGHVEAGLRTHDIYSPFPEEMNRRLTSRIARYHFAPTQNNRATLIKEQVRAEDIFVTGNTIIDTLMITLQRISQDDELKNQVHASISRSGYNACAGGRRKCVLVTSHRRENLGEGLRNVCAALLRVAVSFPEVDVVFPVHKNPKVREVVHSTLGAKKNIYLLEPLDYFEFVYLLSKSHFVITDSGGIQEEAPSLKKPVIVVRESTERVEAQQNGNVKLVGTDEEAIFQEASRILTDTVAYESYLGSPNPYGDGHAAERIAGFLAERL